MNYLIRNGLVPFALELDPGRTAFGCRQWRRKNSGTQKNSKPKIMIDKRKNNNTNNCWTIEEYKSKWRELIEIGRHSNKKRQTGVIPPLTRIGLLMFGSFSYSYFFLFAIKSTKQKKKEQQKIIINTQKKTKKKKN